MKVAFAENNVIGSQGLQATKGFSINASAHAFKILSSGLYSDKVRAVLREIGCNAVDAHIVAGCPSRPIRVKLPNRLDDQFYVQDWGLGLSHDEVMNLYTTYFASTKQSSNDLTGAFGLGSKSPFSYTDSFSVVSTHKDKKRTYTLYIGNEGAPVVSLLAEEDAEADWKSGIRVGFAVRPDDYQEFVDKAQETYRWFAVTPEIRGSKPIDPVRYRYECDDFKRMRDAPDNALFALMGGVCYPIKSEALGIKDISQTPKAKLHDFAHGIHGLVLCLPIGSVQVAASREELQYDPASVAVMKEKIGLAVSRVGKDMITVLEEAEKGGWKELCASNERLEKVMGGSMKYYFEAFLGTMGIAKARATQLYKFVSKDNIPVPKDIGETASFKIVRNGHHSVQATFVRNGKTSFNRPMYLEVHPNTVIASGVAKYATLRAKRAIEEGKYHQILLLTSTPSMKATEAECAAEAAALARAVGGMDIIDVGTLPPPDVLPSAAKKRRKKGEVPTLPVGENFNTQVMRDKKYIELSEISPLFVCTADKTSWGSDRKRVRFLKGTVDTDDIIDRSEWDHVWASYCKVQECLQLPDAPSSYVYLTAHRIKSLRLVEMGWRNTHDALAEYAARPEVRDGLKARVKKKSFVAPEYLHAVHDSEWMQALSFILKNMPKSKSLDKLLEDKALWPTLSKMAHAKQREAVVPPEVTCYQSMVRQFRLEDALAPTVIDALTIEDLDAAFRSRFPLCEPISAHDFVTFYESQPTLAEGLLAFILSKETVP